MSQLNIFNDLIIFIFAGTYTNIYESIISSRTYCNQYMSINNLKLSTVSCAYEFLSYSLVDKSFNPHG